jgi:hypothetical protein
MENQSFFYFQQAFNGSKAKKRKIQMNSRSNFPSNPHHNPLLPPKLHQQISTQLSSISLAFHEFLSMFTPCLLHHNNLTSHDRPSSANDKHISPPDVPVNDCITRWLFDRPRLHNSWHSGRRIIIDCASWLKTKKSLSISKQFFIEKSRSDGGKMLRAWLKVEKLECGVGKS